MCRTQGLVKTAACLYMAPASGNMVCLSFPLFRQIWSCLLPLLKPFPHVVFICYSEQSLPVFWVCLLTLACQSKIMLVFLCVHILVEEAVKRTLLLF